MLCCPISKRFWEFKDILYMYLTCLRKGRITNLKMIVQLFLESNFTDLLDLRWSVKNRGRMKFQLIMNKKLHSQSVIFVFKRNNKSFLDHWIVLRTFFHISFIYGPFWWRFALSKNNVIIDKKKQQWSVQVLNSFNKDYTKKGWG